MDAIFPFRQIKFLLFARIFITILQLHTCDIDFIDAFCTFIAIDSQYDISILM